MDQKLLSLRFFNKCNQKIINILFEIWAGFSDEQPLKTQLLEQSYYIIKNLLCSVNKTDLLLDVSISACSDFTWLCNAAVFLDFLFYLFIVQCSFFFYYIVYK